ncbi:unnamed protein product [Ascophyllum nodosum]
MADAGRFANRDKTLDDKRRRLDELRQRKKAKEIAAKVASDTAPVPPPTDDFDPDKSWYSAADDTNASRGGADLDAYIKSLLETPAVGGASAAGGSGSGVQTAASPGTEDAEISSGPANESFSTSKSDGRIAERLSSLTITSGLAVVHVLPKLVEFYDKACQADFGGATGDVEVEAINGIHGINKSALTPSKKTPDKRRNHLRVFGRGGKGVPVFGHDTNGSDVEDLGLSSGGGPSLVAAASPLRGGGSRPMVSTPVGKAGRWPDGGGLFAFPMTPPPQPLPSAAGKDKGKDLSSDQKKEILQTDHFQDFLRRSSRVLERALGEREALDVLADYAAGEGDSTLRGDQGQRLNEAMTLHEDRWCQERALTDLQWSPHRPELVLTSYSARGHSVEAPSSSSLLTTTNTDADGLVLVWSLAMQHRPEFQLSSQSPVLTARFHPYDPHVIIGGTYSGQASHESHNTVWDTRAKSLPVQRTPLSATGHTYPVYNLHIGGTANAPSLLTASTDGRVSTWNPSQLNQPLQVMRLSHDGAPVTISTMAVAEGDEQKHPKQLVVGSESGAIYTTPLHFRKSGAVEKYEGHYGLVTSVDANPSASKSLRGLVLSSSVDWTTRLWRLGKGNAPVQTHTHGTYDYVCDAKWSPKHPALFVTANISGELGLWNLNHSMEEPFAPPVKAVDRCALTRMAWSPDGRRLCVGDSKGYARVFNVDQETALPRPDDEMKLEATLAAMTNRNIDKGIAVT